MLLCYHHNTSITSPTPANNTLSWSDPVFLSNPGHLMAYLGLGGTRSWPVNTGGGTGDGQPFVKTAVEKPAFGQKVIKLLIQFSIGSMLLCLQPKLGEWPMIGQPFHVVQCFATAFDWGIMVQGRHANCAVNNNHPAALLQEGRQVLVMNIKTSTVQIIPPD